MPFLVIAGWVMGKEMTLEFPPIEVRGGDKREGVCVCVCMDVCMSVPKRDEWMRDNLMHMSAYLCPRLFLPTTSTPNHTHTHEHRW